MATNANLRKAKDKKNDEFYTQLTDVAEELKHYRQHFVGKIVFCNCDDPTRSAFWKYFHLNFSVLGLRKLISTHYDKNEPTYKMEYEGGDDDNIKVGMVTLLEGNGDFRNQECLDLLDECDIVVTNPPFSLFREYVKTLMEHGKKFIIIGNKNAITYREIFPLIRDNQIWTGCRNFSGGMWFYSETEGKIEKFIDGKRIVNVPSIWFTNLDHKYRHEYLVLCRSYSPENYIKYDNYNVIECSKVADIPVDYNGVMGVPITFLNKYNPEQFEIIGMAEDNGRGFSGSAAEWDGINPRCIVDGKIMYKRIFIKKR